MCDINVTLSWGSCSAANDPPPGYLHRAVMELLAEHKYRKKRAEQEKERSRKLEEEGTGITTNANGVTKAEEIAWKKQFGYASPPYAVYSIGKSESAAVWWPWTEKDDVPDDQRVVEWIVRRYRRDSPLPGVPWHCKGFKSYKVLQKKQVLIQNLTNGYQYCFTVQCRDARGSSAESDFSNPVMVDSDLPAGWFRFYDEPSCRFYFANLKTRQSSWTRPELDPFFLEESIHFNFTEREIRHLRLLYDEDMHHRTTVSVDQFLDCLLECGEKVTKRRLIKLFIGYAKDEFELKSWTAFMNIMNHIKKSKTAPLFVAPPNPAVLIARAVAAAALNAEKSKLLGWNYEYSSIADKYYYINKQTGESRWDMPDELRFFIPAKLNDTLTEVFDYGHIESFKHHFSLLDVDASGDLTARELRLLFTALGVAISDSQLDRLVSVVDLNGNGVIGFDEFCYMMLTLAQKEKNGVFKDIITLAGDNSALRDSVIDTAMISANLMKQQSIRNEDDQSCVDGDEKEGPVAQGGGLVLPPREDASGAAGERGLEAAVGEATRPTSSEQGDGGDEEIQLLQVRHKYILHKYMYSLQPPHTTLC